ncbi:MAG: Atxe2 family lasso peptide isopeptidase [Asticcacaulis sp.]|uniref:Atxe2 family lasso peptide isopeptidase n=1 Tax=Asticcacaulis sp. TaxID=1872648 RepID=UPI003F7BFF6D
MIKYRFTLAGISLACLCALPAKAENISPRALVELADISHVKISPDGAEVAFRVERPSVERNTVLTTWYVKRLHSDAPPIAIADGGTALHTDAGLVLNEAPIWSPDSQYVFYRALWKGQVQLWSARADGSGAHALTSEPGDIIDATLATDGQSLLFRTGAVRADIRAAEMKEYNQGIRIDGSVNIGMPLFRYNDYDAGLYTHRFNGAWMQQGRLLSDAPLSVKRVNWLSLQVNAASQADWSQATHDATMPAGAPADATMIAKGADGAAAFITQTTRSALTALQAGHTLICPAPSCTQARITSVRWRPGASEVIFTSTPVNSVAMETLHAWNVVTGKVRDLLATDGTLTGQPSGLVEDGCSVGKDDAVCVLASENTPPCLVQVDLDTGQVKTLFDPNAGVRIAESEHARALSWKDKEGLAFSGVFMPAQGAKPLHGYPLFIQYYKCKGFPRGGVGDEWPFRSLSEAGIAVLCIQARPPHPDDAVADYKMAQSGVSAAIDLLSRTANIDPDRVGMGGLSFGSEITMWMAMRTNLLRTASISSPSITPFYYWIHMNNATGFQARLKRRWGLGAPNPGDPQWRTVSPAFQTDNVHIPLLFQMSEEEYLQSIEYVAPLWTRHLADMYVFPYEPHIKYQPVHKLAVYTRNLDWLRYWLQDYEDPAPEKAEQYALWRQMKAHDGSRGLSTQGENPATPHVGLSQLQ